MEGVGLNADMWINGVKCLRVIDEGNGGEFIYRKVYDEKNDELIDENIKVLNEYIKLLPPLKSEYFEESSEFLFSADSRFCSDSASICSSC